MSRLLGMRRDWRRGRLSASVDAYGLNLPRVIIYGEGTDFAYASIQYGSAGSDPVVSIDVELTGTRLARAICWVAWKIREARS